jgi:hypothetical protein
MAEGRDSFRRKAVLPRGREEIIFVLRVQAGELEQEIPEIHADTRFVLEEGTQIEAQTHALHVCSKRPKSQFRMGR